MEIHFELNHECLLRCRHCSSSADSNRGKMCYTVEDMKRFLTLFPQERHVFLTGGEPLLCGNLDSILLSLADVPKSGSIGLFTTGIIYGQGELCAVQPEQAQSLAVHGLKTCYFSLYAPSAQDHEWVTGIQGSFNLTLESIQNMRKQGVEAKVNLVVSRKNRDQLHLIIALASRLGCAEIRMLKPVCHGRATQCWTDFGLTNQEYQSCVAGVLNNTRSDIKITASSCIDLLPCRPFDDAQGCQAGSKLAYVTIEGDVYPCASAKKRPRYKIGNIKEIESIRTYFESSNFSNNAMLCTTL